MTDHTHSRISILKARMRLADLLDTIADGVTELSLERCPYRAVDDVCTFEHGCRNQLRGDDVVRCGGGPLDTTPAMP